MYGIIDCDNCYVSCERVFRPDLNGKPVVVLSNNDGCIVARSNEAKKLGIKAGLPYFKLQEQFPDQKIAVFSSNYELYGESTGRVVEIIRQEAPQYFRYSGFSHRVSVILRCILSGSVSFLCIFIVIQSIYFFLGDIDVVPYLSDWN